MFGLNIKNRHQDKIQGPVTSGKATHGRNTLCNNINSTRLCRCRKWRRRWFRFKTMCSSSMLGRSRNCWSQDSNAISHSAVLHKNTKSYQKRNSQPLMTQKSTLCPQGWQEWSKLQAFSHAQLIINLQTTSCQCLSRTASGVRVTLKANL